MPLDPFTYLLTQLLLLLVGALRKILTGGLVSSCWHCWLLNPAIAYCIAIVLKEPSAFFCVLLVELTNKRFNLEDWRRVKLQFFAVSDSSQCPDIGTSWCHSGIIEHFEIWGFENEPTGLEYGSKIKSAWILFKSITDYTPLLMNSKNVIVF